MNEAMEGLLKDINDRLAAIGESVNEKRLEELVKTQLSALLGDEGFVRKMRFGSGGDPRLLGTKYFRWGLNVADIEFLFDLQESLRGQRKTSGGVHEGPSEELRKTFEAISGAYYLPTEEVKRIDQRAIDDLYPRVPLSWLHGKDRRLAKQGAWEQMEAYQAATRAMDTAESGYGSQLIGAQYVGELWDVARAESRIFGLFDTFEMTAPVAYLPVEVDFPEMLFVAENTSPTASDYATVKTGSNRVSVTAFKFLIHQMWSGEMEEDSIIPFVPFLRRQAMLGLAYYSDSACLNGDTTNEGTGNINLHNADPADTKHYLAFDGIRHAAMVDVTGNKKDMAAALNYDQLVFEKGNMVDNTYKVDWGHPNDPEDLVYIADPESCDRIALLDEVITVDKFGSQATVLTGQQARIGRHPLISSMAMSKTEADGFVNSTASNNTKGQVALVNRRGFKVGWRRRIKLETERLPGRDQTRLVYSLRMGFGRFSPTGAVTGIEAADVIYDITL